MDWFFRLLGFAFTAGQVCACLCLAYGGYLCIRATLREAFSDQPQPQLRGGVHRFGAVADARRAQHL
jgi:hypothetical protein